MFDIREEIEIDMRLAATGGAVSTFRVRYPTDEEWLAHIRKKKFIFRSLGRGVNETIEPAPNESDVALIEKLKLNGAPPMTPAEAAKVLDILSECKVIEVKLEGTEAEVEMRIFTGESVRHRLRIPSIDQASRYKTSAARRLEMPHSQSQVTFNQQVGAEIYDQLGGHSDDYPGGVPIAHKHDAFRAVYDEIEREYQPRAKDDAF